MRIVIVGGVAAGTSAAAKARRNNEENEIVVQQSKKDIFRYMPDSDELVHLFRTPNQRGLTSESPHTPAAFVQGGGVAPECASTKMPVP